MAIFNDSDFIGWLTAAGDYNDAVDQYCVVRSTGTNFTITTTLDGLALGVLQDKPSSGTPGLIKVMGQTKVRVNTTSHAAIKVFDKLSPSSGGGIKMSTGGADGYVLGRALETLAANTTGIIRMLITHQGGGSSGTTGAVA